MHYMAMAPASPSFPRLYLTDMPSLDDLPDGKFKFSGVGKVVRHTEEDIDGEKHCSCEIEVYSIEPEGEKSTDLGKALDKIATKKMEVDDEEAETEPDDEEAEGESL